MLSGHTVQVSAVSWRRPCRVMHLSHHSHSELSSNERLKGQAAPQPTPYPTITLSAPLLLSDPAS